MVYTNVGQVAKLADFGLAKVLDSTKTIGYLVSIIACYEVSSHACLLQWIVALHQEF